ncbi:MAG TPA: alcohol dehydrogenase catalytic domain-containing protein, partial [Acidimicrobiales bacterium]|nr:alcohol dehydrogenase catalytic domain-containing protein [Acidimicrobiales bacterium]
MRAAVAAGRGVEVLDVPEPTPSAGQVLAVPRAAGICGSDLHLVDAYDAAGPGVAPIVLGHEFCAEVLEAGPGAVVRPGTRVVSVPFAMGSATPEPLGLSPALPGAFAERMVLDERSLLHVPDHVSNEVAALTEPLAVGVHAVRAGRPQQGDVLLV